MQNNSSHNNLNNRLFQGLSRIPSDWSLCLLDGKKVPQGIGWQKKPLTPAQMKEAVTNGYVVDKADGTQYRCYPKGYGLITGTAVTINSDIFYIMALDQDGASASQKILELSGGEELPKTVAFTSGRPGRCQYLFLVPEQYAGSLCTKKFPTGVTGDDGKGEQLELRWTGLQSCLPPSVHPTTGEYVWVPNCAPDQIQIAIAPIWIIEQMLVEKSESGNSNQLPLQAVTETRFDSKQQWTEVDWALSYLAALSPYRADDYHEWCTVGMILKSIDDSLLHEWDNWSRQSSKYKPGECEKKWKSFHGNKAGIGTLAHWAKQDGWTSPFKEREPVNNSRNERHFNSKPSLKNGDGGREDSANKDPDLNGNSTHGSSYRDNDPFLYKQVTTIVTSELNPPQQTAALIELSTEDGYPLNGVKDLAQEIEAHINRSESKTEDTLELQKLLDYRNQKLKFTQILPPPLAQALLTKAHSDCIDPVYLYQYLLASCGSSMGGHIGMIGKEGETVADSWVEYPIFWTMVVALPSAGKSQTMRSVFGPIKRRQKQAKKQHNKLKEQLEKQEEEWAKKSDKQKEKLKNSLSNPKVFKATMSSPPPKHLIEAGSPEGALRRMSELAPKSGCAWVFDELVRLLKLDQYKDKGGDTRQILLQTWNAPADIEFERSDEKDSFELKDVCLSLTGATQLSKVKQLFSDPDDGDGLISRFLIAIPTTPDNFAVWSDTQVAIDRKLQHLYDHLRSLPSRLRNNEPTEEDEELPPILLSFTRDAKERWKRWWEEVRRTQLSVEYDNPAFFAYLGKMLSQTLRLALLLHCIELKYEEKKDPLRVGIDTLERAIQAASFSIGQFRILQTNNHEADSLPGRLSLIHAYALRKGTEVTAVQVQNTVFKRAKANKPTLAQIRQDFATLTESGYAVLSGKGKDLRLKAIPVQKARVGIPTSSDQNSDPPQKSRMQTSGGTQPPVSQNSDNSDDFWADPIGTAPERGGLSPQDKSDDAQNGRNCRNYDDDITSKVDAEPISGAENSSENCRNGVGNSDNYFDEDSGIKLENESDDDPDPDDDPKGSGNVPKPDTPPAGDGGNELLNDEETANSQPNSRTTETELLQECLRLREQLQQQSKLVRGDERNSTFELLQALLTNYSTAIAMAKANSEMPAQNLVSLFTPLDNLLRSWGIEAIGKVWEQVPYNPQLHTSDADDLTEGEQVFVRFVGYRDGSRILCPAKVSRTLPSVEKSCGSE
ncbi:MAG TPA: hypothetical protein DDW76_09770 [Cyanobacteria bacterium UBA11369]|nr:hypothetical protein [Cyanobacteria bacterium UBA11371]HBE36135.1 hypothetical protein [Cyanobacteria bacterium UBA11368]HBE49060.1 hypothetical protein [Cyanobacteria bacterium UBA11369]